MTIQVPEARVFMVADIEACWNELARQHCARLGEIHHEPACGNGLFLVSTAVGTREELAALDVATHDLDRRLNDPRRLADAG